jgi:aspartate 1-decarboxylase
MLETVMKGKIHRATVTMANLDYEGSIDIATELMDASGIRPYEQVMVANFTNGKRWWTYAVPAGPGVIGLNGGSARQGVVGDLVAIFAFAQVEAGEEAHPRIVLVDEGNAIRRTIDR